MDLHMFEQYGLVGLMSGAIIILLFLVVKWTLKTTQEILKQAASERECWIKAFNDHTTQARIFYETVKEAHQYQRQEHQEMIKALGRINGWTDAKH